MKRKHLIKALAVMGVAYTSDQRLKKRELRALIAHEQMHGMFKHLLAADETSESLSKSDAEAVYKQVIGSNDEYESIWGTTVGQDCVDLCTVLPRWLGERLTFLGNHTSSCPMSYHEALGDAGPIVWKADLIRKGAALTRWANAGELDLSDTEEDTARLEAQKALRWAADNMQSLWD